AVMSTRLFLRFISVSNSKVKSKSHLAKSFLRRLSSDYQTSQQNGFAVDGRRLYLRAMSMTGRVGPGHLQSGTDNHQFLEFKDRMS
ncbi:hypothetical protein D0O09_32525, partial [Pseudomonas putida]